MIQSKGVGRVARWRGCAAVAVCLLAVAGCGKRETSVDAGIRSKTLLIGNLAEPASLDPHIINSLTDMHIVAALFEGLTVLDEKTSAGLPGVAERWDVSPDGLVYTFHLRATARWSNGDPVTAQDFVYSFERLLAPKFAAEYAYMVWPIKNAEKFNKGAVTSFAEVGAKALDARTLQVTLERPTPYLPSLATHATWMPVHRATVEKFGAADDRASRWSRAGNLVGNGAFTLKEWQANARVVVAKNARYWDAANTKVNEVVFFPIENPDTEERNFRAGQLHVTYDLPKAKIPSYRASAPESLRIDPLLSIVYLNFNVQKPPFNDARVRRALALAIDREAISRTVLNGAWPAATSFTPPDAGGYTARARIGHDVAGARRLLAEAGHEGGKGIPVIPVQVLNDANQSRIMEAIQAMWQRDLGVRITIEPYEQKTWLQNQQSRAHTLATLGWTGDFADPVTFLDILTTGNGNNWSNWSDKTYDGFMQQAADTTDPAARLELFQQAEALLLEAAPAIPLLFKAQSYLIHPSVKGWDPAPLGIRRYQRIALEP